jgi:ABC-2 type transport system permease protein
MLAIFRRELKAYFTSPIGFIFLGFFILLSGVFFAVGNLLQASPDYTGMLSSITFVFLILVPILTMRLLSEETRQKTDQLLITSPLTITGIVMGKYLAAVAVFLITLLVTVLYPLMISFFALLGLAGWEILGGYLGFFLLGCAFIAVGLFFSSLTDNQLIAAVVTFAALLFMWIIDAIAPNVPSDPVSGLVFVSLIAAAVVVLLYASTRNIPVTAAAGGLCAAALALSFIFMRSSYDGLITKILGWFSLLKRYNQFNLGILSLSPIVYYITFSAAFVFLTVRMLERKRWA